MATLNVIIYVSVTKARIHASYFVQLQFHLCFISQEW